MIYGDLNAGREEPARAGLPRSEASGAEGGASKD